MGTIVETTVSISSHAGNKAKSHDARARIWGNIYNMRQTEDIAVFKTFSISCLLGYTYIKTAIV